MNIRWPRLVLLGLITAGITFNAPAADKGDKKVDTRVFELRTYFVLPGRMPAMHARFKNHTNKLLEKHGMTLIGFWNPEGKDGETKLIYLVAHSSREAADKNWKAFQDDPDWKAARDASEKDGKIVEKVERIYMTPAEYSALK